MSIIRGLSQSEASDIGDEPGDVEIGVVYGPKHTSTIVYQRGAQFFAVYVAGDWTVGGDEVTEDDPIVREARP